MGKLLDKIYSGIAIMMIVTGFMLFNLHSIIGHFLASILLGFGIVFLILDIVYISLPWVKTYE